MLRNNITAVSENGKTVISYKGQKLHLPFIGTISTTLVFLTYLAAAGNKGNSQHEFLAKMFGQKLLDELLEAANHTPTSIDD